jgi:hypothetical protein
LSFSHAIALTESQPGHYAGQIAEGWDIGGNANGGYLLALAANGLRQHLGRPDPVSITAHYLRPGKVGPAAVHCETVKEGKRFATARATLEGPGGAVLSVLGTFGNLEDGTAGPTQVRLEPPALPAVEDCFPLGSGSGEGFAPSLMDRIDARLDPEDAGFRNGQSRGIPEMRGYFRLPDEDPCSVLGLLLGLDAFPPTIFNANLPVAWTPTVELTCHLRRRPAPGWLRARFVTRVISSGFLEEDGELWDSTGQLVAQSRQLALVPKVAAP